MQHVWIVGKATSSTQVIFEMKSIHRSASGCFAALDGNMKIRSITHSLHLKCTSAGCSSVNRSDSAPVHSCIPAGHTGRVSHPAAHSHHTTRHQRDLPAFPCRLSHMEHGLPATLTTTDATSQSGGLTERTNCSGDAGRVRACWEKNSGSTRVD